LIGPLPCVPGEGLNQPLPLTGRPDVHPSRPVPSPERPDQPSAGSGVLRPRRSRSPSDTGLGKQDCREVAGPAGSRSVCVRRVPSRSASSAGWRWRRERRRAHLRIGWGSRTRPITNPERCSRAGLAVRGGGGSSPWRRRPDRVVRSGRGEETPWTRRTSGTTTCATRTASSHPLPWSASTRRAS
jgi:hypothetical protein